jgi:hypothetical protein
MHGENLGVLVEGNADDARIAALRAKDFDDAAKVLCGAAVGSDGVGRVFKEDDGVGVRGYSGSFCWAAVRTQSGTVSGLEANEGRAPIRIRLKAAGLRNSLRTCSTRGSVRWIVQFLMACV